VPAPTAISDNGAARLRVFFALTPDAATRERIRLRARDFDAGGRVVPAQNYHITLVFIGAVGPERLACLEQAAARVAVQPFTLSLDRVAVFPRRALWFGCQEMPDELRILQRKLSSVLEQHCRYRPEDRPYVPHVTLQRKPRIVIGQSLEPAIAWRVDSFSLMRSDSTAAGPVYSEIARWS